MKILLFILALSTSAHASVSTEVDMALNAAPYILSLDDHKPLKNISRVFVSQAASVGIYALNHRSIDPWTLSTATNMALLCNLHEEFACHAGIVAGSYVLYHRSHLGTNSAIGLTIGVASGSLVPGIVANF